jgi:hypothetical protein
MDRILCCIPTYDGPGAQTFFRFLMLAAAAGQAEAAGQYQVRWNVGGPRVKVQNVRNQACQYAILGQAHYLAFIDDDMVVPENLFARLLAADKPIVSPIFFRNANPYDPLVFNLGTDGEPYPMSHYPVDQVFAAPGGVGTGVMLIRVEVLRAMQDDEPWFRYPADSGRSMDLDFCLRAARHGYVSYCDSSLLVEQMGLPQPCGKAQWEMRRQLHKREQANG